MNARPRCSAWRGHDWRPAIRPARPLRTRICSTTGRIPALAEARRGARRGKATKVASTDAAITKQRVWFTDGPLVLEGYLFKPAGAGPFPVVLWNHGSEKNPGAGRQFDGIA